MKSRVPVRIRTIQALHELRGLPKPEHPLISVVDYAMMRHNPENDPDSWASEFYSISMKRTTNAKIKYGQQAYDFDEGILFFMAPGQVFSISRNDDVHPPQHTGWLLLIHPDFFWNTPLAKGIKKFAYFDYAVNEALFLSAKEEAVLNGIIENIRHEYHANIDRFSQGIIISQIETLLNYSERFYQRQFITRKITNHQVLGRLENLLEAYFDTENLAEKGLPTVQYISEALQISPGYLRNLLSSLTGQNTQQHIHNKLIEKAKEKLSTTGLSVGEIAYELGFEHSQSFSKLFKAKTSLSPLAFRQSFN